MSEENGPYTLKISKRARDALARLDKPTAERIVKKLIWLAENASSVAHWRINRTVEWVLSLSRRQLSHPLHHRPRVTCD
jgi:hypothetical protein